MQGLLNTLGGGQTASPLGQLGQLAPLAMGGMGGNNQGMLGGLTNLLGGCKCTQNEQRLMQEKLARNQLKKYLTAQGGDPIQSALISNTIPGKGALDDFDVGLGSKNALMKSMGPGFFNQNNGILGSMGGLGGNNSMLGNLSTLGSMANLGGNRSMLGNMGGLANLGNNPCANTGLLSQLVGLAGTPNNNGNIMNALGGLGGGSGFLGNIQSGLNTLNTLNKVNNAVSGIAGIF